MTEGIKGQEGWSLPEEGVGWGVGCAASGISWSYLDALEISAGYMDDGLGYQSVAQLLLLLKWQEEYIFR